MKMFKQVTFKRDEDFKTSIKRSNWQFFIPGVNSGVYRPKTLCVSIRIEELKAKFFALKPSVSFSQITLSYDEFDELFEEMQKIKQLRDKRNN